MMVERKTPTKQQLEALYDLINTLLPDKDVYYTTEELEALSKTKGFEII